MKIVNLIRERKSEDEIWVNTFIAEDWVENVEQALRESVEEFLKTEKGLMSVRETCDDYNWGDFVMDLPVDILAKHGLKNDDSELQTVEIKVNQDEILCKGLDIPFSVIEDNGYVLISENIRMSLNVINEDLSAEKIEEIIKNELGDNLKDICVDEVVSILKSDYNCVSV